MKKYLIYTNKDEDGFVLVLLPLLVLALLGGLGLVVDSANMYAAQVKAGTAAEQGVLSSIGSLIAESDQTVKVNLNSAGAESVERTYLTERYRNSSRNNLLVNNIKDTGGKFTLGTRIDGTNLSINPIAGDINLTTRVTGEVRLEVPVFFKPVYDIYSRNSVIPSNVVLGYATSELRGSAFVFLMDLSSSQGCPSVGACLCRTNRRDTVGSCRQEAATNPGGTGRVRIEDIRLATQNVLRGLDARRDRVTIVIYNNSAQVIFPLRALTQPGFDLNAAIASLDRIVPEDQSSSVSNPIIPNGNTNISDAILTGQAELQRVGLLNSPDWRGRINMILLSDGAPTAMRVIPESGQLFNNAPGNNDPDGHPVPQGDYITFQLAKETAANTFLHLPGPFIRTLQYKGLVNVDISNTSRPLTNPMVPVSAAETPTEGYPDTFLPDCHLVGGKADKFLFSDKNDERANALANCLPSNSFKVKGEKDGFNSSYFTISDSLPPPINDSTPAPSIPKDFRQMYYLAAVQAVERLAPFNIRFFTLSWGPNQPPDKNKVFDVDSVSNVKKEVLANLANDPYSSDFNQDPNSPNYNKNDDLWGNEQFKNLFGDDQRGFRAKAAKGIPNGGTYVAIDAAGLNRLFASIIQTAKLSVISVLPPNYGGSGSPLGGSGLGGIGAGEGEGGDDNNDPGPLYGNGSGATPTPNRTVYPRTTSTPKAKPSPTPDNGKGDDCDDDKKKK